MAAPLGAPAHPGSKLHGLGKNRLVLAIGLAVVGYLFLRSRSSAPAAAAVDTTGVTASDGSLSGLGVAPGGDTSSTELAASLSGFDSRLGALEAYAQSDWENAATITQTLNEITTKLGDKPAPLTSANARNYFSDPLEGVIDKRMISGSPVYRDSGGWYTLAGVAGGGVVKNFINGTINFGGANYQVDATGDLTPITAPTPNASLYAPAATLPPAPIPTNTSPAPAPPTYPTPARDGIPTPVGGTSPKPVAPTELAVYVGTQRLAAGRNQRLELER